jgi:rhodanese-related sulfurtransferase
MQQLSPPDLKSWLADVDRFAPFLLDVREPWEYARCHIEGSHLIPMASVPARIAEVPQDRDVVVICHHGGRSQQVGFYLAQAGFERVHNLQGGVNGWALHVDPAMPRY